jgi:hypothetical protein
MFPAGMLPLKNRRGTPTRLLNRGRPAAKVAHLSAPLKGLSRSAALRETDPLLASVLTNWIVLDDRISVRPGYTKIAQLASNTPISTLIPYYGNNVIPRLAAASGGKLYDLVGGQVAAGYDVNGDDWAWTTFSNLSTADYTILCNGFDGVNSWDGTVFRQEPITVGVETWINPLKFDKVLSHMNRLWFADSENLAIYYLPLQQKSGAVELFPLDVLFKRGGHIQAIATWSIDGGTGLDDALAIFSSNGEVAIYSGVDPESDFKLVGIFRFDAPMSKNSLINFGGDLYVMISTGLVPMTTLIRAETENLGLSDMNVMDEFERVAKNNRPDFGWQVILNGHTGHAICNLPLNNGGYQQMVRKMPSQVWTKWTGVPSRCWGWLDNHTYFGDDTGGIYRGGTEYLSDNGKAIEVDLQFAWSSYKSVSIKDFKLVKLYTISDGLVRPFIDMQVDYNNTLPINQPETDDGPFGGAVWDVATWDVDYWNSDPIARKHWQGVTGLGRVGAPRLRASVLGCTYAITGIDVIYEQGGLL